MRNRLLFALGLTTLLGLPVLAASERLKFPLVAYKREQFENILWEEDRVQMGKTSVTGILQGTGAGEALIAFDLKGEWELLESDIGYLNSASSGRSCTFEVQADGESIYTSDVIKSGEQPQHIKIPIKGHKILILRIHPERYGATAGAVFGSPELIRGVSPDELTQSLQLDVDGHKTQITQPGGHAPKEIGVPIPLNPGTSEYRVKVVYDKANNKATFTTEPLTSPKP